MASSNLNPTDQPGSAHAGRIARRAAIFVVIWWILTEGRFTEPAVAVISIIVALFAAHRLWPPAGWRLRPSGMLPFAAFFAWHAFRGGVDVALRAMRPRMRLDPGFMEHPLRLSKHQTLVLVWSISLLPGTASVRIQHGALKIHVLDRRMPTREVLEALERRVAALCG
jgi:multicomponent Na+:H+ antiporter subunit E